MEPSVSRTNQHDRLVDPERFRSVMSRFASGVTIITTRYEGIDYGLTASAVSSLSLDPPMLLICVNKTSNTQKAIAQSQVFAVNILRENQSAVARHFASSRPQKFGGMSVSYGALGIPFLGDALATIECRVTEEVTGGTHSVFLAEVKTAQAAEGMPLTYFRGRMGRFEFMSVDAGHLSGRICNRRRPLERDVNVFDNGSTTTHKHIEGNTCLTNSTHRQKCFLNSLRHLLPRNYCPISHGISKKPCVGAAPPGMELRMRRQKALARQRVPDEIYT